MKQIKHINENNKKYKLSIIILNRRHRKLGEKTPSFGEQNRRVSTTLSWCQDNEG
jgi:hypothetical protein